MCSWYVVSRDYPICYVYYDVIVFKSYTSQYNILRQVTIAILFLFFVSLFRRHPSYLQINFSSILHCQTISELQRFSFFSFIDDFYFTSSVTFIPIIIENNSRIIDNFRPSLSDGFFCRDSRLNLYVRTLVMTFSRSFIHDIHSTRKNRFRLFSWWGSVRKITITRQVPFWHWTMEIHLKSVPSGHKWRVFGIISKKL